MSAQTEQEKDLEAANRMRVWHCAHPDNEVFRDRAISALEERAKGPKGISLHDIWACVGYGLEKEDPTFRRMKESCIAAFEQLLNQNNLLIKPRQPAHPLDALRFTHVTPSNWNEIADKVNALIDHLKAQEARK